MGKYSSSVESQLSSNSHNEEDDTVDQLWKTLKKAIQTAANNHLKKSKILKNKSMKANFHNLTVIYLLNTSACILRKVQKLKQNNELLLFASLKKINQSIDNINNKISNHKLLSIPSIFSNTDTDQWINTQKISQKT